MAKLTLRQVKHHVDRLSLRDRRELAQWLNSFTETSGQTDVNSSRLLLFSSIVQYEASEKEVPGVPDSGGGACREAVMELRLNGDLVHRIVKKAKPFHLSKDEWYYESLAEETEEVSEFFMSHLNDHLRQSLEHLVKQLEVFRNPNRELYEKNRDSILEGTANTIAERLGKPLKLENKPGPKPDALIAARNRRVAHFYEGLLPHWQTAVDKFKADETGEKWRKEVRDIFEDCGLPVLDVLIERLIEPSSKDSLTTPPYELAAEHAARLCSIEPRNGSYDYENLKKMIEAGKKILDEERRSDEEEDA
ncbi:MAG: hypothetical protein U0Z53_14435 [Blastocatellia bacterium]